MCDWCQVGALGHALLFLNSLLWALPSSSDCRLNSWFRQGIRVVPRHGSLDSSINRLTYDDDNPFSRRCTTG